MNRPTFTDLHRATIKDHNAEGFDSVDSEDFDAGFGCVPIEEPLAVPEPPAVPQWMTEEEIEQEKYYQWWLRQR